MISETLTVPTRDPGGRPRTRVEVDDVPRLHLPSMLASRQAVPGAVVSTDMAWPVAGGREVRARVVAELKERDSKVIVFPDVGQCYIVEATSDPQPFGGWRWWFICPVRRIAVTALYLPPGAERFASRQAHGLAYRSQRVRDRRAAA